MEFDNIHSSLPGFAFGDEGLRPRQLPGNCYLGKAGLLPGLAKPFQEMSVFAAIRSIFQGGSDYCEPLADIPNRDILNSGFKSFEFFRDSSQSRLMVEDPFLPVSLLELKLYSMTPRELRRNLRNCQRARKEASRRFYLAWVRNRVCLLLSLVTLAVFGWVAPFVLVRSWFGENAHLLWWILAIGWACLITWLLDRNEELNETSRQWLADEAEWRREGAMHRSTISAIKRRLQEQ